MESFVTRKRPENYSNEYRNPNTVPEIRGMDIAPVNTHSKLFPSTCGAAPDGRPRQKLGQAKMVNPGIL